MHLDTQVVACPFEPFLQTMDVRYCYRDVFVVWSTVVAVVGLLGCMFIVDAVFVVKFAL